MDIVQWERHLTCMLLTFVQTRAGPMVPSGGIHEHRSRIVPDHIMYEPMSSKYV